MKFSAYSLQWLVAALGISYVLGLLLMGTFTSAPGVPSDSLVPSWVQPIVYFPGVTIIVFIAYCVVCFMRDDTNK